MGGEIIVFAIVNLFILGFCVVVRFIRDILVSNSVIEEKIGPGYQFYAMVSIALVIFPSLSLLFQAGISNIVVTFILFIQMPIAYITLLMIMSKEDWKNLTNDLTGTR